MKCDYLNLRLHPAPTKAIELACTTPSGILLAGRKLVDLLADQTQLGHVAVCHGAIHLTLTGAFWRRHNSLLHNSVNDNTVNADLASLQQYLIDTIHPATISVSRIDFVAEHPTTPDKARHDIQLYAISLLARWPTMACDQHIESATGISHYIGAAGRNPDEMRSRSPFCRIYHRYGSGTVRIELEYKGIPGETAQEQVLLAQASTRTLLGPLNSPDDAMPQTSDLPSRRVVPNHELAARLIGSLYNRLYHEHGGHLPDEAVRVAARMCRLLGVSTQYAYARRPKTAEPIGEEKP